MCRCSHILLSLLLVSMVPAVASAQSAVTPSAQGSQQQQAPPAVPADQLFKPERLEALVAPIALYPDDLLANVLAAATYPLEVVQADRWIKEHKTLKGDVLKTEVEKQLWDDSVKALVSTASVLTMMSDKIDWTKDLGDAVLAQQADVMDAVQRLRSKAYANKKLETTKQQKVSVQVQDNRQVVVIESADPNMVYVPYYNPAVVYGEWPYPDYLPYYFGAPAYVGAGLLAAGLAFGTGWAIARWGNYWGGGFNWGNRNLYVNHFGRTNVGAGWQHNPAHRHGVRYSGAGVQQRFGNANLKAGSAARADFRGREGPQGARPEQRGAGRADQARDRGAGERTGDRGNRARAADSARSGAKGSTKSGAKSGNRSAAKGSGSRAKTADRGRSTATRGGGGRDTAFRNVSAGRAVGLQSARGQMSLASRGSMGMARASGGFAGRGGFGGGGGFRGGGGGGFRGGGGRRSDIALKHDIVFLGRLASGIGYYRFSYIDDEHGRAFVGVMAQEVQQVAPQAVARGRDGFLRVDYRQLGLKLRTYDDWLASGARMPTLSRSVMR